jgi:hypothetical protein
LIHDQVKLRILLIQAVPLPALVAAIPNKIWPIFEKFPAETWFRSEFSRAMWVAQNFQKVVEIFARAEVRAQIRAQIQFFWKSPSRREFPSAMHECAPQRVLSNEATMGSQIVLVGEKMPFW